MHHLKKKIKNFLPSGALWECLPGPHCGSRRTWFWSVDRWCCCQLWRHV